jgi:competence protein ComEC
MKRTYILLSATTLLLFFTILVWHEAAAKDESLLTVSFLDVGQGDATLIEAPNGVQMLIDGGKGSEVLSELGAVMNSYDKDIDIILATHPDADHIGGLVPVLADFQVHHILTNGDWGTTQIAKSMKKESEEEGAEVRVIKRGDRIMLDGAHNVYVDVFYPGSESTARDTNGNSIIAKLVYGENEFLLTGDAPLDAEARILYWCASCLSSDVLKVGHHGSKTSTGKTFLEAVHPEYAIISAGLNNRYGHPHKQVTDLLDKENITTLGTYDEGTIQFETDGKTLRRVGN